MNANVWLALAFSDHVHHAKAKAWFETQSDGTCGFCRVTQMALLRHLTNAKIMGQFVQSQQDAWRHYDKLASDLRVFFLTEPSTLETAFQKFTPATSPSHALWTDAFLAAFAVESQAQLVTFDQGFTGSQDWIWGSWVDPKLTGASSRHPVQLIWPLPFKAPFDRRGHEGLQGQEIARVSLIQRIEIRNVVLQSGFLCL